MKDSWVAAGIAAVAIVGMAAIAWQFRGRVFTGYNDFTQLYAGARLVGTSGLYDAARVMEVQRQTVGVTADSWRYTRLPYYAALLWPLGRLPYRTAYLIWEVLAIAALIGFVSLWKRPSISATVIFSALSLPAFTSLMNGQDLTFVLLFIAVAVACRDAGKPFLAGFVLVLCAAKYHLFALVPLFLVARREYRFALGLLSGGAALIALSFGVAGASWPKEYFSVLTDPKIHPAAGHMPNLHGLVAPWPALRWLEWVLAAGVIAAVWIIGRRASFDYGLAAALSGGLLVSYHAYLPDCSVLLPAALILIGVTAWRWLRFLAVILLTPASYLLLLADSAITTLLPLAILVVLVGMLLESWRAPQEQPSGA